MTNEMSVAVAVEPVERELQLEAAINSNNLLPGVMQIEICDLFYKSQEELSLLNAEISRVRSILDSLLHQHSKHVAHMSKLCAGLAPLRKVPPEILATIFMHLVEGPIYIPGSKSTGPWYLTQVCSKWRQVALNTPGLWNNVHVDYMDWSDTSHLSGVVRELFARSQESLISLLNKGTPSVSWETGSNPITDIAIPYVGRLKNISFEFPPSWLKPFFELPPGSIDSLESATFFLLPDTNTRFDTPASMQITVFKDASSLRKVEFLSDESCPIIHPPLLNLPWEQLTDLNFVGTFIPAFMAHLMLSQCTSLLSCKLALAYQDTIIQRPDLVVVPCLRLFTLDTSYINTLDHFLNVLVLPSLESFELVSEFGKQWPQSEFVALMGRSACTLKKFSTTINIPSRDLETLFTGLDSLVELSLPSSEDSLPDSVINGLIDAKLLPKLEKITCRVVSLDLFIDMLKDRWFGVGAPYVGIHSANIYCAADAPGLFQAKERLRRIKALSSGREFTLNGPSYYTHI